MKQSVSLITLGVSDYERAKSFYEALGWTITLEIQETAFFQANGVVVVLWAREKLADGAATSCSACAASRPSQLSLFLSRRRAERWVH